MKSTNQSFFVVQCFCRTGALSFVMFSANSLYIRKPCAIFFYEKKWEGAVKAGKDMANAIVEYIGGIEVVKAFSQSAGSYKKYSDAVNYNANYYVEWMRENQKTMSAYNAILPSVLICVLPCGFAFWLSGSLELSAFLSIVIFSLGLVGPIMSVFTFTDDLAVLGTNVEEISQLLNSVSFPI